MEHPRSSWILVLVAEETSTLQPAIPNRYVPLGAIVYVAAPEKIGFFAEPPETVTDNFTYSRS